MHLIGPTRQCLPAAALQDSYPMCSCAAAATGGPPPQEKLARFASHICTCAISPSSSGGQPARRLAPARRAHPPQPLAGSAKGLLQPPRAVSVLTFLAARCRRFLPLLLLAELQRAVGNLDHPYIFLVVGKHDVQAVKVVGTHNSDALRVARACVLVAAREARLAARQRRIVAGRYGARLGEAEAIAREGHHKRVAPGGPALRAGVGQHVGGTAGQRAGIQVAAVVREVGVAEQARPGPCGIVAVHPLEGVVGAAVAEHCHLLLAPGDVPVRGLVLRNPLPHYRLALEGVGVPAREVRRIAQQRGVALRLAVHGAQQPDALGGRAGEVLRGRAICRPEHLAQALVGVHPPQQQSFRQRGWVDAVLTVGGHCVPAPLKHHARRCEEVCGLRCCADIGEQHVGAVCGRPENAVVRRGVQHALPWLLLVPRRVLPGDEEEAVVEVDHRRVVVRAVLRRRAVHFPVHRVPGLERAEAAGVGSLRVVARIRGAADVPGGVHSRRWAQQRGNEAGHQRRTKGACRPRTCIRDDVVVLAGHGADINGDSQSRFLDSVRRLSRMLLVVLCLNLLMP
mmetsp:Transcript_28547/g.71541  ORF Transcript_28547/g.71541 Transcript_28547/m.71541 type:complete len:568 (-) Transcript_28547:18-1721(-)